jgi:hypothetical protein
VTALFNLELPAYKDRPGPAASDRESRTGSDWSHKSHGDADAHEHVDDHLVMTLLQRLQELVGPDFGLIHDSLLSNFCDDLAGILEHYLSAACRFKLLHRIYPSDFQIEDSTIDEDTVRHYISQYLMGHMQLQEEKSEESSDAWWSRITGGRGGERKDAESALSDEGGPEQRRRDRGGETGILDSLFVQGDRKGPRTDTEKPKPPAAKSDSDLSTPIANLLTDLRTMHDDM